MKTVNTNLIFLSRKNHQLFITENTLPVEMATRNKKKLAALNKENCEEHPRSNLAQNSNVPRSQEDCITQVFEEIEGTVTKKLSQEFSRTENGILGALARLGDFITNPTIQGHSGTAPETSRNVFSIRQETNEDDYQSNCRSIPAKPTYIKKEKDIPRLPEIQKKLYQYFRLSFPFI